MAEMEQALELEAAISELMQTCAGITLRYYRGSIIDNQSPWWSCEVLPQDDSWKTGEGVGGGYAETMLGAIRAVQDRLNHREEMLRESKP